MDPDHAKCSTLTAPKGYVLKPHADSILCADKKCNVIDDAATCFDAQSGIRVGVILAVVAIVVILVLVLVFEIQTTKHPKYKKREVEVKRAAKKEPKIQERIVHVPKVEVKEVIKYVPKIEYREKTVHRHVPAARPVQLVQQPVVLSQKVYSSASPRQISPRRAATTASYSSTPMRQISPMRSASTVPATAKAEENKFWSKANQVPSWPTFESENRAVGA